MKTDELIPKIGMRIKTGHGDSRVSGTIIAIHNDRRIEAQMDSETKLHPGTFHPDGISREEDWGFIIEVTKRKDGRWRVLGSKGNGCGWVYKE